MAVVGSVMCPECALRPLSPLVLSAWESATDLPPLSWETGVQLSAGRVSVSPRESPLIAVQSGTHLARDLAVCGLRLWEVCGMQRAGLVIFVLLRACARGLPVRASPTAPASRGNFRCEPCAVDQHARCRRVARLHVNDQITLTRRESAGLAMVNRQRPAQVKRAGQVPVSIFAVGPQR